MTNFKFLSVFLFLSLICFIPVIHAENWPCWRGPNGDGTSTETNLPVEWDSNKNVVWKSVVPGTGHSSPIIWEDKLFTLTALAETQEKVLLCYNALNGDLIWQKTVIKSSSNPETKAREIYDALSYKYQPWIRKSLPVRPTGVLPEKQSRKTDNADNIEITS